MTKLFSSYQSETGLFKKSSCQAPALGLIKFSIARDMILVTLFFQTKMFNKPTSAFVNLAT
jgi:hypothetical protein